MNKTTTSELIKVSPRKCLWTHDDQRPWIGVVDATNDGDHEVFERSSADERREDSVRECGLSDRSAVQLEIENWSYETWEKIPIKLSTVQKGGDSR